MIERNPPGIGFGGRFRADLLGFLYEFFSAFGAGDGDFAFSTGDTDLLAATGTIVVTVIPVLQPLEEHEKFFVFLVPLIGISGKTAEDHPN